MIDSGLNGGADKPHADKLAPLPGERGIPDVAQPPRVSVSRKGLVAVALLVVSLIAVSAVSIQRSISSGRKPDDAESKRAGDRPAAASFEPKRLDLSAPTAMRPASAPGSTTRIPALVPTADELAEPIGVHRSGQGAPANSGPKPMAPEDAPAVLIASRPNAIGNSTPASPGQDAIAPDAPSGGPLQQTRRNLEAYQRQLQGVLDTLQRSAAPASGPMPALPSGGLSGLAQAGVAGPSSATSGLFGGQLPGSATPRATAAMLGNRSLILPKGTAFTCALKTKLVSATSGLVGCQVQRNVYSGDGRTLLIERGSHMDGEYRSTAVRPGTVRVPVLWTRIRTPNGVTVDIESPGTGALGESGIDGYVDNRWVERIGAAMLLSLIDDSVKLIASNQVGNGGDGTVVLSSTTSSPSKLAEKVLDSTINIPPLIYQNQGAIVGIYVARDVDFSSVYELQPTPR
jgi:type IV secretion system protein VirB10